ncbi:phosphohydrolase [Hafnia paralvei ATCC 29927]|uniref:MSMEG_1061 family FMN-dependent PPOX-type flavoprotein n=1 Tax=Hafnia paralvei TaxID=546367 RepID=UPI0007E36EDB|nr:MSMEG_1061 family FMN-dependent PPOX-type flavoprotein [Hafnia paralvei]MDU1191386.1 pyridoxamine 5'-phosphate oxidase family protein [Enterobacteriaceae bacterium]MDU1242748.1 pyridoxamine 5'-phosphate oxidase family protein [Enterobacteriaceae bacterium]OAT39770.1 phosphohydrolase [Hafnia paralvei ATCC 29927]HCU15869.1 pyridoxamine 5-phosphate oxidase [Hafnia paralvei]
MQLNPEFIIADEQKLREHYAQPNKMVLQKQIDHIDSYARQLIEASPFVVISTIGEKGMDCSPKGGDEGFVQVADEKTLLLPDLPGNNRLDGISNLLHNPTIGLLFLIPGWSEAFRVNGTAQISVDPDLCERFYVQENAARSVLVINVEEAFIHCGRAVTFGGLWDTERHINPKSLPSIMEIAHAHIALSQAPSRD